ncbi:hypothetical protein [Hymenobacter sp. 102]|uniref:hypothetical protein n=1 Tax=Hymenobacter sp. 102 TaxID=3403152 RepID=UPI003CE9319E
MLLLLYLRAGLMITAFYLVVDMLAGATIQQAIVVQGVRCELRKLPLVITALLMLMVWPVGVVYSLRIVLGLLPRKSFDELYEEGTQ